ncbi:hypothetical protein [Streptomyces sp. NPDC005125]
MIKANDASRQQAEAPPHEADERHERAECQLEKGLQALREAVIRARRLLQES